MVNGNIIFKEKSLMIHPVIAILVTLITLLIIGYARYLQLCWRKQKQTRQGLAAIIHLKSLIDSCQQHRGTSNAFCLGNHHLRPQLSALQTTINQAVADEKATFLTGFPQWQSFIEHWPRLQKHALAADLKSHQLVRQHNLMIDGQLLLLDDVARYYDLHHVMLDPVTRVSELCLDTLRAAETVGQTRAIGSGICARGRSEGTDAMMLEFLRVSVKSKTDELLRELSAIKNESLVSQFKLATESIKQHTAALLQIVEQQVLTGGEVTLDSRQFFTAASQPIEALMHVFNIIIEHTKKHHATA